MNFSTPTAKVRRSPLYRWHLAQSGQFVRLGDEMVVRQYRETAAELDIAKRAGLCDLSTLARSGVNGPGSKDYLLARGTDLPENANQSRRQANGDLVSRLSEFEYLRLGTAHFSDASETSPDWGGDSAVRAYDIPRRDSHGWFVVSGRQAENVFAKLCGVDLRAGKFADGEVAQTSLALLSSIIIRHDIGQTPAYFVLMASTASEYVWECLFDAMQEFDGCAIGFDAVKYLSK